MNELCFVSNQKQLKIPHKSGADSKICLEI
jgi:hypothetical protein